MRGVCGGYTECSYSYLRSALSSAVISGLFLLSLIAACLEGNQLGFGLIIGPIEYVLLIRSMRREILGVILP
jgi:hypothetical protein